MSFENLPGLLTCYLVTLAPCVVLSVFALLSAGPNNKPGPLAAASLGLSALCGTALFFYGGGLLHPLPFLIPVVLSGAALWRGTSSGSP